MWFFDWKTSDFIFPHNKWDVLSAITATWEVFSWTTNSGSSWMELPPEVITWRRSLKRTSDALAAWWPFWTPGTSRCIYGECGLVISSVGSIRFYLSVGFDFLSKKWDDDVLVYVRLTNTSWDWTTCERYATRTRGWWLPAFLFDSIPIHSAK